MKDELKALLLDWLTKRSEGQETVYTDDLKLANDLELKYEDKTHEEIIKVLTDAGVKLLEEQAKAAKEEDAKREAEKKAKAEKEAKAAYVKFLEQDALSINKIAKEFDKVLKELQGAIVRRKQNKGSIISLQAIQRQIRAIKKSIKRLQ